MPASAGPSRTDEPALRSSVPWHRAPRSRWARSALTFGPVGRIVATLAMLLPLWWFVSDAGVFAVVGVPVWCYLLARWALPHVWEPVRQKPTDRHLLEARYADLTREPPAVEPIATRTAPPRW